MPELPEVEIVKRSLKNKVNYKKIKKIIITNRDLRFKIQKNFEKIVNNYDQIIEVHRLTGSNSDYQITILAPSIREYDIFQQKLIKEIECS